MTDPNKSEVNVVSNCANPNCGAPFRFMHSGRVFRFDFPVGDAPVVGQDIMWDADGIPRRTELFWLCENCVRGMTLVKGAHGEVRIERLATAAGGK